ncbi:MAG: hypothetical protein K6E28_04390 [Eubacterium sp.]|nr:hypothetical protein [Eubacterium sp.]
MDSTSVYGLIIIVALILLAFVIALIVKLNNKYKRSEEKRIEKERRGETRSGRLHYGDEYKTAVDYYPGGGHSEVLTRGVYNETHSSSMPEKSVKGKKYAPVEEKKSDVSVFLTYSSNRSVWLCKVCETENTPDSFVCCVCNQRRV